MFCKQCGAMIPDGVQVCSNCGTIVGGAQPSAAPDAGQNEGHAAQQENTYSVPQDNAYTAGQGAYSAPQGGAYAQYGQQNAQYARPSYSAPGQQQFYDCGIRTRDIVTSVILSVVTCGIYSIYWFIKMVDDVNRASNDQGAYSGGITFLLNFVTCGIYGIYWYYQAGKKMNYAKQVRGIPVTENAEILYLVIALIAPIVNMCLIQTDLNKMATPAQ